MLKVFNFNSPSTTWKGKDIGRKTFMLKGYNPSLYTALVARNVFYIRH